MIKTHQFVVRRTAYFLGRISAWIARPYWSPLKQEPQLQGETFVACYLYRDSGSSFRVVSAAPGQVYSPARNAAVAVVAAGRGSRRRRCYALVGSPARRRLRPAARCLRRRRPGRLDRGRTTTAPVVFGPGGTDVACSSFPGRRTWRRPGVQDRCCRHYCCWCVCHSASSRRCLGDVGGAAAARRPGRCPGDSITRTTTSHLRWR